MRAATLFPRVRQAIARLAFLALIWASVRAGLVIVPILAVATTNPLAAIRPRHVASTCELLAAAEVPNTDVLTFVAPLDISIQSVDIGLHRARSVARASGGAQESHPVQSRMHSQFLTRPAGATSSARAILLLVAGACATGTRGNFPADQAARPAVGAPAAFTFSVPVAGDACRNPALDPRDGARLALVRSSAGRGDYEAPAGRYGVSGREYLRLDCVSGTTVGVVPR